MVTIWQDFSAVKKAFTTVSDQWPAIILSAVVELEKKNTNKEFNCVYGACNLTK